MPKSEPDIKSSFNSSPARVKLTPDGIVEEYSVSPPPFVRSQTITINIPKTMDTFDQISKNFSGINGIIKNPPVKILPIGGVLPKPINIKPYLPVKPPVILPVNPVVPNPPFIAGGGGAGINPAGNNGSDSNKDAPEESSHIIPYSIAAIGGGGVGYLIGKKYKHGLIGGIAGGVVFFGLTWLYFKNPVKYS